jgi:hypothetical protein
MVSPNSPEEEGLVLWVFSGLFLVGSGYVLGLAAPMPLTVTPELRENIQAASHFLTMTSVMFGILALLYQRYRERLAREQDTFLQSNARYADYLRACLEHPDLDAYDILQKDSTAATIEHRQLILYSLLTAMLETAFLLYRRGTSRIQREQRKAWDVYIGMWAKRADYRSAWPLLKPQFHQEFADEMSRRIAETAGS